MSALTELAATEMAELIRRKKISPVELVAAHLDRSAKLKLSVNAIVDLDVARALQQARGVERAVMQGEEIGPLAGVPMTIKSSIEVAGLCCDAGTKLREGAVAQSDAPLVVRVKAAGAIVLGTTNVPEMLMAYETVNLLHGRTNNPWDLERTPGGSSGGEAAAIAAGCSPMGVGSDGGGSIRVPAHFCGICGLKPTPGRIPATGHYPPSLGPFALLGVVGPMARTVADLELLFEVMAGPDTGDPSSVPVPFRRPKEEEVRGLRIGYFDDDGTTPVTPETRAAVGAAAQALAQQGFEVESFRPEGLARIREVWWTFFGLGGGMLIRPMFAGREADLSPILKAYLDQVAAEPPLTLERFSNAWFERDVCRIELLKQMCRYPILLCPVCAIPAFRHGEREWNVEGRRVAYLDSGADIFSYSQWFNLTGNPAAVVPVGRSPEGLPIGVQIVGRPYEEELVLAVARHVERACGGWNPPPLAAS